MYFPYHNREKDYPKNLDPEEVEELAISAVEMVNNEDTKGIKSLVMMT